MDLKSYQAQIKELIPLRNEPDYTQLLDKLFFGESNSEKFLIKMEINRLTQPCKRILDIRDKVTEPCVMFELEKIKHYLTKSAIKVLQENIKLYGLYTIGVYEAVHEHVAEKKVKSKIQQLTKFSKAPKKEQCEKLHLSQENKRGAPRMFFVSPVSIMLTDKTRFEAHTSNVSSTGLKIKIIDDIHVNNDSLLSVTFTGLNLEYNDAGLKKPVNYQLVKQENDIEDCQYFYLNYIDDNSAFTKFISEFIRLNQYKYKIDVHYYYQLAKINTLKHSFLAQMNSLPIYIDSKAHMPFLFALKNNCNKTLLNEWHCAGFDQLPFLFNELRFIKLLSHLKNAGYTTVYTFTHTVNNKQYFLSATEEELLEKKLKKVFINYGHTKESWRVYHLTIKKYHYKSSNDFDITESIPNIFQKVTHLATLQRLPIQAIFTDNSTLEASVLNQLNQFVHKNNELSPTALSFRLFSDEQRKEERYLYSSKLSVSSKTSTYNGQIIDFSNTGLKIKLDQISTFSASSKLKVNLIELQKVSPNYPLSDLHYRVVKTGPNNILHLQICNKKTLETCQKFFSLLVKKNAKHFTCQPLTEEKQPPHNHLIEIAKDSFHHCVFFINYKTGTPAISFAAIEHGNQPLHTLFSLYSDNKDEFNYYPIANNQLYERLVIQPFKVAESNPLEKEAIIYIKATQDSAKKWVVKSFLDEDFKSEQAKIMFIKESQFNATFYALHYRLTSLPNNGLESIKPEIRAISRFAVHLTKKLEEELCNITAMIEITDRTAATIKAIETKAE